MLAVARRAVHAFKRDAQVQDVVFIVGFVELVCKVFRREVADVFERIVEDARDAHIACDDVLARLQRIEIHKTRAP